MEDGLVVISKLQKLMRNNLQIIGDTMITGGVDNMEKYKYLLDKLIHIKLCYRKSLTC